MKVLVSNIVYSERTREWNISIDAIRSYKEYKDNSQADHSIWNFNNFMTFNNELPDKFIINVPYENLVQNITEIEQHIKSEIKKKTYRDVESFTITEAQ